jgi:hypothetical protein
VARTGRKIGAVALGIASQVGLTALKYLSSMDKVKSAEEALRGTHKVLQILQERLARDSAGELAVDEAMADVLPEKIEYLRCVGSANADFADLYTASVTNYKGEGRAHADIVFDPKHESRPRQKSIDNRGNSPVTFS